jgi:hypothetical protein
VAFLIYTPYIRYAFVKSKEDDKDDKKDKKDKNKKTERWCLSLCTRCVDERRLTINERGVTVNERGWLRMFWQYAKSESSHRALWRLQEAI